MKKAHAILLSLVALLGLAAVGLGIYLRSKKPKVAAAPPTPTVEEAPPQPPSAPPMTPAAPAPGVPAESQEVIDRFTNEPWPENLDRATREVERSIRSNFARTGVSPERVVEEILARKPEQRKATIETCKELEKQNRDVPRRYTDSLAEWKKMESSTPEEARRAKGALYMSLYLNRLNHEYCKGIIGP